MVVVVVVVVVVYPWRATHTRRSIIANLSLGNTTGNCNLRDPRFSNKHALQKKELLEN